MTIFAYTKKENEFKEKQVKTENVWFQETKNFDLR